MFFKRGQNTAQSDPASQSNAVAPQGQMANGGEPVAWIDAPAHAPLSPEALRKTVDPASLGFSTTAELEPAHDPIGQERALKAIAFGSDMPSHDFNIFVLGPPASGKSTAVKAYLREKTAEPKPISDWVYVNNFADPNRPRALRLVCGTAIHFEHAMIAAVDELRQTVPAMFESEEYEAQARQINDGFRSGQEEAFEALNKKAEAQNIAIIRTPMGITLAPMHEGSVVKPEVFRTLPEDMRKAIEAKIEVLQAELSEILQTVPKSDKERREKLASLNREFGTEIVTAALAEIRTQFAELADVVAHLDAVAEDMVRNIALFLPDEEEAKQLVKQSVETSRNPKYRRYMVNVVVSNDGQGLCAVPVIEETNPNYGNLIGRIENIAQMGTLMTDFLLLKPGALHRANGGYLLLDVRKLLMVPFAWEALKRAIKSRAIRVEQPSEVSGLMSTQTLDPEPIPLDVKVILFGDRQLYYALAGVDPDFTRLFQVQADFEDAIERNEANNQAYGRLIASIVAEHDLLHVDATGVAGLIEEGARLASDRDKVSVEIGRLADLVREADYWARKNGSDLICRADLDTAIAHSIERSDRIRDRSQETITRDIVMIETTGSAVGQINGLAVLQIGTFAFGKPSRITARVRLGRGQITDIEREAKLGGALHTKGVMILWGFLSGRFAQDIPLALAATIVFEQSYGGVDGDSASSTELYALMSALSGVPIRQGLAVTGSVNQFGEVQAIGGANEKIEGFFDVCNASGLTGEQGVLIPASNAQHLMLRQEIVEACQAGQFHIHAVETIDQGIEILTGVAAGEAASDGSYPEGTINRLVRDRLVGFAKDGRSFAKSLEDETGAT